MKSSASLPAHGADAPATEAQSFAGWRDFNVNHYVRIRLTDVGRKALKDNHDALWAGVPKPPPFRLYDSWAPDADGWTKMQAWEVMKEFGPHIGNGRPVPFETTIRIECPDGAPLTVAAPSGGCADGLAQDEPQAAITKAGGQS